MKRSNHIPASILARLYLALCLLAVLPLETSTALAQGAKKVPFPFSPIGLNCLPWFVAKDARLFEKHAIDFDPVFIGASSALLCYRARRMNNLADPKLAAALTAYYDNRYVDEVKRSGFFDQLWL